MKKRTLELKDSAIALLIAFLSSQLFIIIGELVCSAILATIDYSQTQINNFFNSATGYLITSIFQFMAFVLVFIYYSRRTTLKSDCFSNKINSKQSIIFIVLGIITSFALTNFINYYCLTLNLFNNPSAIFSYELNSVKNYLISLISLAIIPAIGEELIFRGIIFNSLKKKGTLFAVIVSGLFFTLFHFNLSQLFYPFLFGILLGFIFAKTKNIIVPMMIHFFNNALNVSIQYFSGSSIFKPTTLNLIFMILGVIIYIGILAYFFYINYKQESSTNNTQEKENTNKIATKSKNLLNRDNIIFWSIIVFMIFLYIILNMGA